MNNFVKHTLLIFLFTAHTFFAWGKNGLFTASENRLIREGRLQLAQLKLENAANDAAGLSYRNTYVIIVGDGSDVDGQFIRQRNVSGNSYYALDKANIQNIDAKLSDINKTSLVKTYVVLVCPLPFEYLNEFPDDKTVLAVIQQKNVDAKKKAHIQVMFRKADEIISAIVAPDLAGANEPTLYCGYVLLQYYKAADREKYKWFYIPKTKNIVLDREYKQLLDAYIKKRSWSEVSHYVKRVTDLIDVLKEVNDEFVNVSDTFLKSDIMKIRDPRLMAYIIDQKLGGEYNLSSLGFEERIHALKILSIGHLDNRMERIVLNLLATVTNPDIDKLFSSLLQTNDFTNTPASIVVGPASLLRCIIKETSDATLPWQDDNYKELMQTISNLIKVSSGFEQREKAFQDNQESRQFIWDESYTLKVLSIPPVGINRYTVKMSSNGLLSVYKEELISHTCHSEPVTTELETVYVDVCEPVWEPHTLELNPFELISIYNRSDLPMLNIAGAKANRWVVMPAIMLQYAYDKRNNQTYGTLALLALDVATIAVPFTRVYDLGVVARNIYRALDLAAAAGSTGNIIVNLAVVHPDFKKIVDNYNMIVGITSLAAIVGGTRISAELCAALIWEFENSKVNKKLWALYEAGNGEAKQIINLVIELKNQFKRLGGDVLKKLSLSKRVKFAADYDPRKSGLIAELFNDLGKSIGTLSKEIESADAIVFKFQSANTNIPPITERVVLNESGIINVNLKIIKIEAEGLTETVLNDIVKYFGKEKIKGINDVWNEVGLAENFTLFRSALENKTRWQAAFETITGKLAKELELERVIFTEDIIVNPNVFRVSFRRHGKIIRTITDESNQPVGILYREENLINQFRYYFESFDGKEKVNQLSFKLINDGELSASLKLPESLKGKGISTAMFEDLINNVLKDGQIKSFHAIWKDEEEMRDNFVIFRKSLDKLQGAFPELNVAEDAALSTPTGHIVSRLLQFTKVKVEIESSGLVRAFFTKEEKGFVTKIVRSNEANTVTTGRLCKVTSGNGRLDYTYVSSVTGKEITETLALTDKGILYVDFGFLKDESLLIEEGNNLAKAILDDAIVYFGDRINVISDVWDVNSENFRLYTEARKAGTYWQAALATTTGQAASKKGLTRVVFKNQKDQQIVPNENGLTVEFKMPGKHVADIKDSNGNLVGAFYLDQGSTDDMLVYYFDTADGTMKVNGLVVRLNDTGVLWAILKLPESLRGHKIATGIFEDAINKFTSNGKEIQIFKDQWSDLEGQNTNFHAYSDAYVKLGNREAAAFATPTGKILQRLLNYKTARVTTDGQKNIAVIFMSYKAAVYDAVNTFKESHSDEKLLLLVNLLTEEMKEDLDGLAKLFKVNGAPPSISGPSQKSYPAKLSVTAVSRQLDIDFGTVLKYFRTEIERKPFELEIQNGVLSSNGIRLSEGQKYNFVMNEKGNIYVALEEAPNTSHAILLAGADLASAGTFIIENGIIKLENWSGHYHPDFESLRHIIVELTARGVDLNSIKVIRFKY